MNVVTLPLENPFEVSDDVIVDIANSKFADEFDQNIITSFIYLRNIEFNGKIDFSNLDFDKKSKILRLYMLRDIKDLKLKQLDCTIFSLFFYNGEIPELIENCIFDNDEIVSFCNNNTDICSELFCQLISIPLYIMQLDKSKTFNMSFDNIMSIDNMPMTYECMLQLLDYKYADVVMLMPKELYPFDVNQTIFNKIFYYDNATLADKVQCLAYSTLYSDVVRSILDENSRKVLQTE